MNNRIKIYNILWSYIEKDADNASMSPEELVNQMLQNHYNLSTLTVKLDITKIYNEIYHLMICNSSKYDELDMNNSLIFKLKKKFILEFKITESLQLFIELYCSSIAKKNKEILHEIYKHMCFEEVLSGYRYRELSRRTVIHKRIYLKSNKNNPYIGIVENLEERIINDMSNEIIMLINYFQKYLD